MSNYGITSQSEPMLLPKISKFGYKRTLPFREYKYLHMPMVDQTYTINNANQPSIKYIPKLSTNWLNSNMKLIYGPSTYHGCDIVNTGSARFDSSSNSIFNRITENGANIITDFQHSNVYMNIVLDFTCSKAQRQTFFNSFGCVGDGDYTNNNISKMINVGGSAATTSTANLQERLTSNDKIINFISST